MYCRDGMTGEIRSCASKKSRSGGFKLGVVLVLETTALMLIFFSVKGLFFDAFVLAVWFGNPAVPLVRL